MSLSEKDVQRFIEICRVPFDGYTDDGRTKRAYARLGKRVAAALADALDEGSANVRWNKAGVAVAGDVRMHGDRIAVYFMGGPAFFQEPAQFFYRRVEGRKDYTGHQNRWLPYSSLGGLGDDPNNCAAVMSMRAALLRPTGRRGI